VKSKLLIILFLLFFFVSFGLAAGPAKWANNDQKEKAIENLLVGLNSDNEGLQSSSAFFLGEYNSSEAVIPLMKILKNSSQEELRIQSALALLKIGDARGIYAIKKAIKYDQSKRVRDICSKFYNAYLSKELTSPL
jgi:HEAT repeat protein